MRVISLNDLRRMPSRSLLALLKLDGFQTDPEGRLSRDTIEQIHNIAAERLEHSAEDDEVKELLLLMSPEFMDLRSRKIEVSHNANGPELPSPPDAQSRCKPNLEVGSLAWDEMNARHAALIRKKNRHGLDPDELRVRGTSTVVSGRLRTNVCCTSEGGRRVYSPEHTDPRPAGC